ncbi:hypothetical protein BCR35DRAFT_303676 [Leucosporidium creatinivorum]|uniref:Succinate dehydrogenase assembly factor 3 n=1 Tax=Leucosporidium creatinivorum TaxID=106004 RepID=A0A1Y2FGG5_9BASI|nr:hypothetical protein BCR35DRAFT_303676 [Leucosporidium creatinivorum]
MSFRTSACRLAAATSKSALTTSAFTSPATAEVASQLLPPLPLYRRLLRVHRKALPIEMRVMGDEYVKAEFRRTRTTDNPLHIVGFLSEWKKYLDFHEAQVAEEAGEIEGGAGQRRREGQKLQEELFEKLSADQIGQLYELLQATKEVYLSPEEIAAKASAEGSPVEGVPKGEVLPDLAAAHPANGGSKQ